MRTFIHGLLAFSHRILWKPHSVTLFSVGLSLSIFCGCESTTVESSTPIQSITRDVIASPVDTAKVQVQGLLETIKAQGEVFFARQVGLSFEVEGWLISERRKDGELVKAGERLATLDTFRIAYQLQQSRLVLAKSELERRSQRILYEVDQDDSGVGIVDSLHLRTKNIDIRTGYVAAVNEVAYLTELAKRHHLVAPFDGQIIGMTYQKGEYIPRGGEVLRLIDLASASIRLELTEQEISQVTLGDLVFVHVPAQRIDLKGVLSSIRPVLNDQGLASVEVSLAQKSNKMMEGMFVQVRIETTLHPKTLTVPIGALLQRQGDPFVFVWESPGKASWKTVAIGHRNEHWVEIKEGLEEEDYVLIRGHDHLSHHAPISVQGSLVE